MTDSARPPTSPLRLGRRPSFTPYYEALGASHDDVLRCRQCRRLVVHQAIIRGGHCPHCATKRFEEVRSLTLWEFLRIKLGLLRFAHRAAFLAEFTDRG